MAAEADIMEIFSSIQGEGPMIGVRQLFVRFYECNLKCIYCDTPSWEAKGAPCRVEKNAGEREFYSIPNPVGLSTLNETLLSLKGFDGLHHSISLTGGEPLLHAGFLKEWLPEAEGDFSFYLETNGTLHKELSEIIGFIDVVSMDIKLPETSGVEPLWDDHYRFLKVATEKEAFVKVVVSGDTSAEEFGRAIQMVSEVDINIPFIIQPATASGSFEKELSETKVLVFHEQAARILNKVMVIPQSHKMLGML